MSFKLKVVNPLNIPGWDEWIISADKYSFFLSSAWAKVLIESYKFRPIYFISSSEKNEMKVLIPLMEVMSFFTGKRGVALPFSDYCEPIIEGNIPIENIFEIIIDYGKLRKWKYLEVRGGKGIFKRVSPYSQYYTHTLDLMNNENDIFSSFRDSTKRNIKKAIREGVEIDISQSYESLRKFYRLNCLTRRLHGLPPQPFYFFKKMYEFVISRDHGIVVLALYKKKAVAGSIFFHFGKNAVFKYAASNSVYHRFRPNNLVLWEAIRWYLNMGYKIMSFGRTDIKNNGLRQYKIGWGVKEDIINYYRFDVMNGGVMKNSKSVFNPPPKICKRIPIPLLKIMGLLFYKHMG